MCKPEADHFLSGQPAILLLPDLLQDLLDLLHQLLDDLFQLLQNVLKHGLETAQAIAAGVRGFYVTRRGGLHLIAGCLWFLAVIELLLKQAGLIMMPRRVGRHRHSRQTADDRQGHKKAAGIKTRFFNASPHICSVLKYRPNKRLNYLKSNLPNTAERTVKRQKTSESNNNVQPEIRRNRNLALKYTSLIPPLIASIQELKKRDDDLEIENAALRRDFGTYKEAHP
jgi:hypothetical protein